MTHFDAAAVGKAAHLLTLLFTPAFLVSLVCLENYLKILLGPTVALQGSEMEILGAYQMMEDVIQVNSNKTDLRPWWFIFFLFFIEKMCFDFFWGRG